MLEKIKQSLTNTKGQKLDKEKMISEYLEKITWEELPEKIKKEAEDQFYKNFNFMALYTPSQQAGLEKYAIYVVLGLQLIFGIHKW